MPHDGLGLLAGDRDWVDERPGLERSSDGDLDFSEEDKYIIVTDVEYNKVQSGLPIELLQMTNPTPQNQIAQGRQSSSRVRQFMGRCCPITQCWKPSRRSTLKHLFTLVHFIGKENLATPGLAVQTEYK
jgi:hypothetical protein